MKLPGQAQGQPRDPEQTNKVLYWWLLLVLFFEYARPGYQFPVLQALPLNSVLPLLLLAVSSVTGGLRPLAEIYRDPLAKWPLVMVLFVLVSMTWASVQTYAYNVFTLILGYFFIFILIVRIVTTARRIRGVFITLIISHLFLIYFNPLVVTDPYTRHYITGATFLGDGNDFSLSLVILIPFALELALAASSKARRILYVAGLGVLVLAIVGTQSRGATLGMVAVFAYLWWRSPNKWLGIVAIVVAAFGVLLYAPDVYFQRLGTLKSAQTESSAEGRLHAWRAGARMAQDNVLGVGAGNFPNNFPKYRASDAPVRWMTAHSMYFLALGELGILGLGIILVFVIGNIRQNARVRRKVIGPPASPPPPATEARRMLDIMSASVAGLAVSGAFLSVTYYPHLFVVTALCVVARHMALHPATSSVVAAKARGTSMPETTPRRVPGLPAPRDAGSEARTVRPMLRRPGRG